MLLWWEKGRVNHDRRTRLPNQLFVGRLQFRERGGVDLPLRRGRQRNLQIPLQAFATVEGQAAPVFQQADHAGDRRVALLGAHARGRFGRKQLATEATTQLLQLVNRRLDRRLANEADQHAGLGDFVNCSPPAVGTRIAG